MCRLFEIVADIWKQDRGADKIFVTNITDYICGEKLPSGEFSEILVKFRVFFFEKAVLSKFVVIYFFVKKYTFVGRKMYPKNFLCGEKMTNIRSE